ncbi:hypothetical protein P3T76_010539 [Phytophthora citrophthora]|uniref:M96 mating-specific protein family n=1 Tax=Phytophthora citrophthora TaxID=4793 RepID=A0AAD9GCG3_9STRA|nr:hypothetical protein P3T76_010539 [Phytophthora citrophthora]
MPYARDSWFVLEHSLGAPEGQAGGPCCLDFCMRLLQPNCIARDRTRVTKMSLLLPDDDAAFEALDAALSFVDACIASPANNGALAPGQKEGSSEDDMMLGDELDELLRVTLSPAPSSSSTSGGESADTHRNPLVLPSPLSPMATNLKPPDVVKIQENGRLRGGGCRKAHCQPVNDATADGKPKKRVKVNPNRARNERKNELAYLRNKVKQMETELDELHRHHRIGSSNAITAAQTAEEKKTEVSTLALTGINAVNGDHIPPFWRDMATRQKLRREKTERENARLKLVLEGQIKLARSMESLLQKRARQQVSECVEHLGKNRAQGSTLDFLADKSTFDALLDSVEAAYREVDQVFATNGLIDSETPSRDACMREGANGMYLDISNNKLLPFSKDAVGAAVWNHFKGTGKHRGNLYEKVAKNIDSADDTVMEDFKMEFTGKTTRADFRVKQVLRRYVEIDREVVVWVTSVHSLDEARVRPFAGLGFAEKGYVVIKRPKSPALVNGGFTVLQMCSLVVPQKAENCSQDATVVGAFTEFVLNVIVANTAENAELSDMLENSNRSPSSEANRPSRGNAQRRARNDRYEELEALRNKVHQMEEELRALRTQHLDNMVPVPISSAPAPTLAFSRQAYGFPVSSSTTSEAPPIWHLTERQQRWREKAERENMRLRMVLDTQASLARSMEAQLGKRIRRQLSSQELSDGLLGGTTTQDHGPDFALETDTVESILRGLDTAFEELDVVFDLNSLETPSTNARIREGASGMYLEIFATRLLPFDFETTATATWNHYRGVERRRENLYQQSKDLCSDTVIEEVAMKFAGKSTFADFRVKQAIRRNVEDDRQVVVWVSKAEAVDQQNSVYTNFAFIDKGYVVVKRPTLLEQDTSSTLLQICCLISPQMTKGHVLDITTAGAFTEFVLSVMVASITATQELVEGMLVDEAQQLIQQRG